MKINKIICDMCGREVNVENDEGLAMFQYIQTKPKISFTAEPINSQSQMKTGKEIVKILYDLCKECADVVVVYVSEKQKENKEVIVKFVKETKKEE